MGSPYSQDLRLRVLAALDSGMTKMAAHQTFKVSRSTIDDWLKLRATTGSVQAITQYQRGSGPAIKDLKAFRRFAQRNKSAKLAQMAEFWEQETGQKLSINTFSVTLRRIGWTRKKGASSIWSETRPSETSSSGS
jgi:transposase